MESAEQMYKVVMTRGLRSKDLGQKSETELYGYLSTRPLARFAPGDVLARLELQDSMTVFFEELGRPERLEITRLS